MDAIPPLGPRPFDLLTLGDEAFEELCFRLIRIEVPSVSATANPDGGADALLRAPGGGFERAWQAKHHTSGISWQKCRESLDRVIETFDVEWVTFCFPIDLTKDLHLRFDAELCRRHPDVRVDSWDASQIRARLTVSDEGQRVARHYFGDPFGEPALIARAIRAGGELSSLEDAIERLRPVGEFLEGHDPSFTYPQFQYRQGQEPPLTPGNVISVESSDGECTVRIDAVPRDTEAADRYRPKLRVAFSGEEGRRERERFEQALARNRPVSVQDGVIVTFDRLPPAFANGVGEPFAATVMIRPQLDPWPAEFLVSSAVAEETLRVQMEPLAEPPAGWDIGYEGRFGGICASVLLNAGAGEEAMFVKWTHTVDGSPARDQLTALRFMAALQGEGTFTLRDCESRVRLIHESTRPEAVEERLTRLLKLLADVVTIEDWVGVELPVPSEISGAEIEAIAVAANQIREREVPFSAQKISLVGPASAIPQLADGENIAISETMVVELFGESVALARRTVRFPGVEVIDCGEVEPGRHAIELLPASGLSPELLCWELEPPL
jgi:hypothetical protein